MFKKRVEIFKKRDRQMWQQIRDTLKEAGLEDVKAGHYMQETVSGGGCGAKLDPRDFGSRGKIDREIYWVRVLPEDEEKAREILRSNGIVAEVEQDIHLDASLRKRPKEGYFEQ